MPYTSVQTEGESKDVSDFSPLTGQNNIFLALLFSSLFFSSHTLPKSQFWDKFQGTFSQHNT